MNIFFIFFLHVIDIFDGKLANSAARDGVVRRGEDGVDELAVDDVTRRLDLVEVERVSAGNGAVEPTFQEGCPEKKRFGFIYFHFITKIFFIYFLI